MNKKEDGGRRQRIDIKNPTLAQTINNILNPSQEITDALSVKDLDPQNIKNFNTLDDFILSIPEENQNRQHQDLLKNNGIPPDFILSTQTISSIHGSIISCKLGTSLPQGRDFQAKPMYIKDKSTNHEFDGMPEQYRARPLLQGLITLDKNLSKMDPKNRQSIREHDITPKAIADLKKKDPDVEALHLSFTLLEILRSVKQGDIEIESIERNQDTNQPSELILKYKDGFGPVEFADNGGRIKIDLTTQLGIRIQKYQTGLVDPEKTRDEELLGDVDDALKGKKEFEPLDMQCLQQLFSKENINSEYHAYVRHPYQKDYQELQVLGRRVKGKVIPIAGDVDLQSLTLSQQLYDTVDTNAKDSLYKPTNVPLQPLANELQQKNELLTQTTLLLGELQPYYKEKINQILESITEKVAAKQDQIDGTTDDKSKQQLEQEKSLLEQQKTLITESKFYTKLSEGTLTLDTLFDDHLAQDYFTSLAGNITPIQFLDKAIINQLSKYEFLQHGADNFGLGEKFTLDTGTHLDIFGDKMFVTTNDEQRVRLWLTKEIFDSQYIHVNPAADMAIWSPLIEAQLKDGKYKNMVDPQTQNNYAKYQIALTTKATKESHLNTLSSKLEQLGSKFTTQENNAITTDEPPPNKKSPTINATPTRRRRIQRGQ